MTNWVEYWDKDRELMRVMGSYVPREGDYVYITLKSKVQIRKVAQVQHLLKKTSLFNERFKVILK